MINEQALEAAADLVTNSNYMTREKQLAIAREIIEAYKAAESADQPVEKPWNIDLLSEEIGYDPIKHPLHAAIEVVGIYPMANGIAENPYEKRTPYMEGWNDAVMTITRNIESICATMPKRESSDVVSALKDLTKYVQEQAAENNLCWALLAKNQVLVKAMNALSKIEDGGSNANSPRK